MDMDELTNPGQKRIDAMRNQLLEMLKCSEIALRNAEVQLHDLDKKYQNKRADYTSKNSA